MRRYDTGVWIWAEALDLLRNDEPVPRRLAAAADVPCWRPAVDMYEQAGELTLFVALPGVRLRQVDVRLEADELVVAGRRPIPAALQRAAIHRLEIPYGRFERRIALPAGNYRVHQQFVEDGCLVLVLRGLC